MASHKRSAQRRQRDAFQAQTWDMDDVFAKEKHRQHAQAAEREAALRHKACSSKNRYATRGDAQAAIASCEAYGKKGLRCYRCSYCGGWHLTSHPQEG